MLVVPAALRAVLDALPDGHSLYELDEPDGVPRLIGRYMNPAGLRLRGLDEASFVGACLLERTRAVGNGEVASRYLEAVRTGCPIRRVLVTDDFIGQPRTFEMNAARVLIDDNPILSMWFRDVTHELRARRRLRDVARSNAELSRLDELTGLPNRRAWQADV